jgi:hypothetical protein
MSKGRSITIVPAELGIEDVVRAYTQVSGENPELEIRFGKERFTFEDGRTRNIYLSKTNFDNVRGILESSGYEAYGPEYSLRVKPHIASVLGQFGFSDRNDIRLEVNGFEAIQRYCANEDLHALIKDELDMSVTIDSADSDQSDQNTSIDVLSAHTYFTHKEKSVQIGSAESRNYMARILNFNSRIALALETRLLGNIEAVKYMVKEWRTLQKSYRYIYRMSYKHPQHPKYRVDMTMVKESNYEQRRYNMRDSNLQSGFEKYEIEVEFDNEECAGSSVADIVAEVKHAIKMVSCGIQSTAYPVSYFQQFDVMREYMSMLYPGKTPPPYGKPVDPRFTPSPSFVALQMENVVAVSEESNVPTIQKEYSVTEKADGLHKMLFIAKDLKMYLIDNNMEPQYTGIVCGEPLLAWSLLDGEHVLYDKNGKYYNHFLVFDIFYVGGVDIRHYPLLADYNPKAHASAAIAKGFIKREDGAFRIFYISRLVVEDGLKIKGQTKLAMVTITAKQYIAASPQQTIFQAAKKVLTATYPYNTDGVIYTPLTLGVGASAPGQALRPPSKMTWEHMFKWKPINELTIDFLATIQKTATREEKVNTMLVKDEVNGGFKQYKTLELRVGFSPKRHGYINPYEMMLNDQLINVDYGDDLGDLVSGGDDYRPVKFYPENPYDPDACYCNVLLQPDRMGVMKMYSEEGDIIEDNTIVECRYDAKERRMWRWKVMRVRYDKTAELRNKRPQYGNNYTTANKNWYVIHNPITPEMITTGQGITMIDSSDVYYKEAARKTKGDRTALQDFHNKYVKYTLITSVCKPGDTLIDFSVGTGGDMQKWIAARLKFVFGMDLHGDGIKNPMFGACKRYLDYRKGIDARFRDTGRAMRALFVQADTGMNVLNGEAAMGNEQTKQIIECVFGIHKHESKLGAGVLAAYGALANGANVASMQFALHYMFESKEKLYGFVKNVYECLKPNGYLIGTCYDGGRVFAALSNVKHGESYVIKKDESVLVSIEKQYDDKLTRLPNGEASLGMAIDVYQDSIGQKIREYLVNFEYFDEVMKNHGFTQLSNEDKKRMHLADSVNTFDELFKQMTFKIVNEKHRYYGRASEMTEAEKELSYLNNYFIYKKKQVKRATVKVV